MPYVTILQKVAALIELIKQKSSEIFEVIIKTITVFSLEIKTTYRSGFDLE